MIKEALQYVFESMTPKTTEIYGLQFLGNKAVTPPTPAAMKFQTLTGLLEFSETGFKKDDLLIHIKDFDTVELVGRETDIAERRIVYALASTEDYLENFPYGQYLPAEDFKVKQQTFFLHGGMRDDLASMIGNMSVANAIDVSDDGVTQTVTMKAGVVLKSKGQLPPIVTLKPFRTFHEAEQPMSDFLLRVRKGRDGELPQIALFEADGRAWILEAIKSIAAYLKTKTDIKILA